MEDNLFAFLMKCINWRSIIVISGISIWYYFNNVLSVTEKALVLTDCVVRYESNGISINCTCDLSFFFTNISGGCLLRPR